MMIWGQAPLLQYLWPNLKLPCCLGTQSLLLGGALTYKSDIGAHTDASNRGTISDNFLAKRGWAIWLIRWQIQKRGVIRHEIAQNPGNFNTFLISLENFDRKSNNWGSLGVKSCKKGRHSVKKRCKKGGLLSGGWHIPANGSVPPIPPSSWPKEVHTYLIPLSQLVISCEFKCSIP